MKRELREKYENSIDREKLIENMPKLSGAAKKSYSKLDRAEFVPGQDQAKILRPMEEEHQSNAYKPYDPKTRAKHSDLPVGTSNKSAEVTIITDA